MKKNILLFLFLFFSSNIIAQKRAFVIFDSDGNQTTYQELVNQSEEADVVLLEAFLLSLLTLFLFNILVTVDSEIKIA